MKKVVWVLIVLIITMIPLPVLAADNSMQIELPEGMEGVSIQYQKDDDEIKNVKVGIENRVCLTGLSDGTYHIVIPETEQYVFKPIDATLPLKISEEEPVVYDLIIHPKYRTKIKETQTPITGDEHKSIIYVVIGIISLIIVVIMSCHNRFKCDKMTGKYFRKRRK